MSNPRKAWLVIVTIVLFQITLRVFEAYDIQKGLRQTAKDFEKSNPVPWSEADHKILAEVRLHRKEVCEQMARGIVEVGALVLLILGARKAIGAYVDEPLPNQEPAGPLPLR